MKTKDTKALDRELNQARSKPDPVVTQGSWRLSAL